MKRFLTAFLLLTALTVSLPSCVIALGNSSGGCPQCEHCQEGGEWDEADWEEEFTFEDATDED